MQPLPIHCGRRVEEYCSGVTEKEPYQKYIQQTLKETFRIKSRKILRMLKQRKQRFERLPQSRKLSLFSNSLRKGYTTAYCNEH